MKIKTKLNSLTLALKNILKSMHSWSGIEKSSKQRTWPVTTRKCFYTWVMTMLSPCSRLHKSCLVKHGGPSDLTCPLISRGETTTIDTYNQNFHPCLPQILSNRLQQIWGFDSRLTNIFPHVLLCLGSISYPCFKRILISQVCVALSCKTKHFLHFPIVRNWSTFVRSAPNRFIYHRALRTKRSFLATLLETRHLYSGYLRDW